MELPEGLTIPDTIQLVRASGIDASRQTGTIEGCCAAIGIEPAGYTLRGRALPRRVAPTAVDGDIVQTGEALAFTAGWARKRDR